MQPNTQLSPQEAQRYSRQMRLPEIGLAGQRRLKAARVLLIGAGGLGSPAAIYLAAAGIGHLGLVDGDAVDRSNIQRQILHGEADIGRPKLDSAAESLAQLNPHVTLSTYAEAFTRHNALDIARGYDLIIDGSDNFPTRYLVNDTAVLLGIPYIYGAVSGFEGQIAVFGAEGGPCYRCVFPAPPPPGSVPTCAEAGVLGALPGTIGTLQATEAIKLLVGIGQPLIGRLLHYDALALTWDTIRVRRRADCPLCGEQPTPRERID